jgi:hypothetical protein
VELHTAENCRIESMQVASEVQVASTGPIKPRRATAQLTATAVGAQNVRGLLVEREVFVVAWARSCLEMQVRRRGAGRRDDTEVEARASFVHRLLLCFHTLATGGGSGNNHCDSSRTFSTYFILILHLHTLGIGAAVIIVGARVALSHKVPSTAYTVGFSYYF